MSLKLGLQHLAMALTCAQKKKKLEKIKRGGSLSFFFAKTWPYAPEITKTMKKGE
jgi:hypothetical protein